MKKKFAIGLTTVCLLLMVALSPAAARAQPASTGTPSVDTTFTTENPQSKRASRKKNKSGEQPSKQGRPRTSSKPESPGTASDSAIAAARSSGKVWVNLDSGIYHKGGRWYGKTNNGKFMTEADAKAAGYKASQRN